MSQGQNAYQNPNTNITSESSINSSIQKQNEYKNIDAQQLQSNNIQQNQNKLFSSNNEVISESYVFRNQLNAKGSIDFQIGVNQQNIFNYADRNESLELSSITQQDPSFLTKQSFPIQNIQTNQSGYMNNHINSKYSSKDREHLDENDPEESRPNRPNIVQSSIEITKPAFNFQNEININIKTKSTKNKNYQSQNQNFMKNEGKNYSSAIPNKIEQIRKIQNTQQINQKDQFQLIQNQQQIKDNKSNYIEIQQKQKVLDNNKKVPKQKTVKTMSENYEAENNMIECKKQDQEKLSQFSNQTTQPMFKQQSKMVINNTSNVQSRLQSASHVSVNKQYNNQKNISIQKKRHRSTSNGINQSYQSGKTATFIEHSIQSQSNFQKMQQQLNNNQNYQQISSINNQNAISTLVSHPIKQSNKSISILNNQLIQRGKDKKNSISPTFMKQVESVSNKIKNNFIQQTYKIQSLSPVELSVKNGGLGNKNFRISSQKDYNNIQSQQQITENNEKREQLLKQLNQNQTSKSQKKSLIQNNCNDHKNKQIEIQTRIYTAQEQKIQRKNQIQINSSSLHSKNGIRKSQEHIIKPNTNKMQISTSDINQKLERYTASFGENALSSNLIDKTNPYSQNEFQNQFSNQNIILNQNQISNGTKIIRPKTNTANSTVSSIQNPIDQIKNDSKNSINLKKNNNQIQIIKQQSKKDVPIIQHEIKKQERQQSFKNAPQKVQQKQEQILIKRGLPRQSNSHKISPKHSSSVVLFKQDDTISQIQDELIVDQNATTPLSDINPLNNYSNLNFASQQTPNMNYINDQHQNTSVSMWSSNQQIAPTNDDQIQQLNQQLPKFFINKNTSATNQSVLSNHSKLSNNLKQNKTNDAHIYIRQDNMNENKVNTTELADYNKDVNDKIQILNENNEFGKLEGLNESNKSFNDEISKLKVNNLMSNYDLKSNDQSQINKDIDLSGKEQNSQLFSNILKNLNIFDENSIQQINKNPEIIYNIQQQIKDIISKQLQMSSQNEDQSTDQSHQPNKTNLLNNSMQEPNQSDISIQNGKKQNIIQQNQKQKHSLPVSPKSKNQIKLNKELLIDKKPQQRLVDLSQIDKSITEISENKKNINNSNKKQINEDINKYASNQQQQSSNSFQNNENDKTEYQKQIMNNNCYIKKNTVTKYAFATRVGYIPMNPNKVNQDSYILSPCIESFKKNYRHMFGVCDGHGQFGHQVSAYIKDNLPKIVKDLISQQLDDSKIPNLVKTNDSYTFLNKEYENLLQSSFLKCDQNMSYSLQNSNKENQESKNEQIDLRLSGSTVCTVCFDGTSIHCANAGDSRAIIATIVEDAEGNLQVTVTPLSEDHKPDLIEEKKRILGMGGRIDTFHDTLNNNEPIGPYRVWLKDQEMPGLAMSRSLGDQIAHSVGVSSLPEIKSRYIGINDKFVVIGSDGVWEFLSNQDVAEVVLPFYKTNQPESAANAIVKAAHLKWREEEEVVDDITAVVIFMEPIMAFQEQNQEELKQVAKSQKDKIGGYFCQKSNSVPVINQ